MIKGVIFDMDGTLVDSSPHFYKLWNTVIEKRFNKTIPKKEFASHMGKSAKEFTQGILDDLDIDEKSENVLPEILDNHDKTSQNVIIKPYVKEVLEKLKGKYKIALATGAPRRLAEGFLAQFSIRDYFDFVIGGDEVSQAKPSPEIFVKAAENLGLKNEECIIVEDAELGIEAAKSAGSTCVAIEDEYTKHHDHSKADFKIQALIELLDILEKL